jgi:hypothetical protein
MRSTSTWIPSTCLRAYSLRTIPTIPSQKSIALRTFSSYSLLAAKKATSPSDEDEDAKQNVGQGEGAMSRRLSEMAEETMDTGSKSDRKLMQDASFSEELKRKLEERIAQTAFQAENQQAFSEVNMPVRFSYSIQSPAFSVNSSCSAISACRSASALTSRAGFGINLSHPSIAVPT